MKHQKIKDIELGFRQLTFDLENKNLKEQDQIMYYIKNMAETNGHIILDEFIQHVKELTECSEFVKQISLFSKEDIQKYF